MSNLVAFVAFHALALMQACPFIPENKPKHNYLVKIFDADASTTELDEIKALLNNARNNFSVPGVPNSMQYESIEKIVRRQQGFCKSDMLVDLVYFTVKTINPINATFYGCDSILFRNVKITFIDQATRKKRDYWNLSGAINWDFNSTFCKCEDDWNRFLKCGRDERMDLITANSNLFFVILATYAGLILFMVCMYRIIWKLCV